jgi:hypothetical protein
MFGQRPEPPELKALLTVDIGKKKEEKDLGHPLVYNS